MSSRNLFCRILSGLKYPVVVVSLSDIIVDG